MTYVATGENMGRVFWVFALLPVAIVGVWADDKGPFEAIDNHALKATKADEKTLVALSKYLVKGCKTDKEKARAIFRWVADKIAYDMDGLLAGDVGDQSPAAVLERRTAVCEGYSNLFLALGTMSKLQVIKIVGHAKGADYRKGKKFLGKPANHAWNAVKLGKDWFLLDCTWGAGSTNGTEFVKRFSECFFLADHDKMIFSHFPLDTRWQLAKKPISLKDFESQVYVQTDLLRLGVTSKSIRDAAKADGFKELVKVYGFPGGSTSILEVPLSKFLEDGKEYQFTIKSRDFETMVVVMKGNQPFYLTKEGDVFSGKFELQKGNVRVGGTLEGEPRAWNIGIQSRVITRIKCWVAGTVFISQGEIAWWQDPF